MFDAYLQTHDLTGMLVAPGGRMPFPPAANREAWAAIAPGLRSQLLAAGEAQAGTPYPMVLATQFLAFCRTGDRGVQQDPLFARRQKLVTAVLAECIARDGRYMDDVVDGLWCICEESFWGASAHNGSMHPGARPMREHPLPDVENPYIDLFAAQTAATLTLTCHLLGDALDAVTPLVRRRVGLEIQRRIIIPFFHHDDFWWMGMIRKDVNNWTPWILSNVMLCLLYWEREDRRLADGLARALRMLDSYLDTMPADGGCDEGAAYWNMAGGALLDCLELLHRATAGQADFFREPHIQAIGLFPLRAHIAGPYFWNFADCDARPPLDGERVYTYGRHIGQPALCALGIALESARPTPLPMDTPEMSRVLHRLFTPMSAVPATTDRETDVILPDLQVWARGRDGCYAAVKAGHNGESHNHNDVGTLLFYVDGEPQLIDVGNMVYTAKTFDETTRYTLWNTRSRNHNVPLIGQWEQAPGRHHSAKNVRMDANGVFMDIAPAYPDAAGVERLTRTLTWDGALKWQDEIQLAQSQPVTWVFMLRHPPQAEPGRVASGKMLLTYDGDLAADCEAIDVTDARMAKNFPGSVYRLTLTAPSALRHKATFQFMRRPL